MTEPTPSNAAEYSVSEIAFALKRTVEDQFGYVRIRGEISGYRGPHSSGHAYFSLKDENARIEAVIWRGVFSRLRVKPEEGMEVIASGKITTYPNASKYQIVIDSLEPAGVGALMALLEARKKKLAAEGLFDPARKQLLPYLPRVIGVVTSPTGAVIRDILHRLTDRFPTRVLLWPVRVQGESCGPEVAAAIVGFNALPEDGPIPRPDLLIVARGGGSLEDLWGFNEEAVVRAAAASEIPLISAVGHETDWTLIDFAADLRAPTPTGAAEMAVPVRSELIDRVDDLARRLAGASRRLVETGRTRLSAAARALPRPTEMLALPRQRLDAAGTQLAQALTTNTTAHARRYERTALRLSPANLTRTYRLFDERLAALAQRRDRAVLELIRGHGRHLEGTAERLSPTHLTRTYRLFGERLAALAQRRDRAVLSLIRAHAARLDRVTGVFAAVNHRATLARGYALVRDDAGVPVFSAAAVQPGMMLEIEFSDGRVRTVAGGPPGRSSRRTGHGSHGGSDDPGQGDLF